MKTGKNQPGMFLEYFKNQKAQYCYSMTASLALSEEENRLKDLALLVNDPRQVCTQGLQQEKKKKRID